MPADTSALRALAKNVLESLGQITISETGPLSETLTISPTPLKIVDVQAVCRAVLAALEVPKAKRPPKVWTEAQESNDKYRRAQYDAGIDAVHEAMLRAMEGEK